MSCIVDLLIWFIGFNIAYGARLLLAFVFLMTLYHKIDKEGTLWKVIRYPAYLVAGVFIVFDVIYNYVLSVAFWDKPAHWKETVTERLTRYMRLDKGTKRYKIAKFFCGIMDRADPGHCKDYNHWK